MQELHKALLTKAIATFIVPTPYAIPFTKKAQINTSELLHSKAQRVPYLSFPKRKFPKLIKRNLLSSTLPLLRQSEFNILHVHWSFPEILLFPEIKKIGKPVILTLHGHLFFEIYNDKSLRHYLEKALDSADLILMVGKKLRSQILNFYPKLRSKSFHLPNGVDETKFKPKNKFLAKEKINWDKNKMHALVVANIAPEKGIIDIVKAVPFLAKDNIIIHIIGRVVHKDYYQDINTFIKKNDINNVIFHGPIPHQSLPAYYNAADLFILPSRSEGFGVSLVEAGMCGIPLISTKSGGPEEIITSENGLLVPQKSPQSLAHAIENIFKNADNYPIDVIRKSMIQRFSQAEITTQLLAHYKKILE